MIKQMGGLVAVLLVLTTTSGQSSSLLEAVEEMGMFSSEGVRFTCGSKYDFDSEYDFMVTKSFWGQRELLIKEGMEYNPVESALPRELGFEDFLLDSDASLDSASLERLAPKESEVIGNFCLINSVEAGDPKFIFNIFGAKILDSTLGETKVAISYQCALPRDVRVTNIATMSSIDLLNQSITLTNVSDIEVELTGDAEGINFRDSPFVSLSGCFKDLSSSTGLRKKSDSLICFAGTYEFLMQQGLRGFETRFRELMRKVETCDTGSCLEKIKVGIHKLEKSISQSARSQNSTVLGEIENTVLKKTFWSEQLSWRQHCFPQ